MKNAIAAYSAAFSACYPATELRFKPAKGGKTWVVINGDKGENPLTQSELEEATRALRA